MSCILLLTIISSLKDFFSMPDIMLIDSSLSIDKLIINNLFGIVVPFLILFVFY